MHRLLIVISARAFMAVTAAPATPCPSYTDVANMSNEAVAAFSLPKYAGTWYEIMSHNLPVLTSGCHCTKYDVALNGSSWGTEFSCRKGSARAEETRLHSSNGAPRDPTLPGKLLEAWDLPLGVKTPATDYWVLDVGLSAGGSYDRVLVYSCTHEVFLKQEWIYFFSRQQSLRAEYAKEWLVFLQNNGIDTTLVTEVPQEAECAPTLQRPIVV
mmetsp:Transcript_64179/g.153049  ORF Transcript_64179/g.153049 Transcript_64179/m.153049 type:complete len:213 (-) Transcript_64179:240-878(-)